MMNIGTIKLDAQIRAQIASMEKAKEAAIAALSDELSDEEWDEELERIFARFDVAPLYLKLYSLEYKECRNEWFAKFVVSFGICTSRRITRKQADVFIRYSERRHEYKPGRGMSYFVRVGDLFVETTIFSDHEPCYVTISKI